MNSVVAVPLWALIVILLFAAVTFASHFLFPSVRWFFRRRAERVVARVNTRLERPIEPFKLAARHDMIQRLIYHPDVMAAVAEYAKKEKVPENVAFERARQYAREIVPSFSAFAYFAIGTRLSRIISNSLYHVRVAGDDQLADIDPNATVIFVMNHRSNVDYVLVTHLAARKSTLSYAVGEWARVWPLTGFIRIMGAYFIRRRSRGGLYRSVLARYVQMSTHGGVTQAIFPEGGLSLDGALAPAKLGLLGYVATAFDINERDVVFVPLAVNYDRVLEDNILIAAGQRGDRKFGAKITVVTGFWLKHLWLRITGRYKKFGYAGASFGRPLSLADRVNAGQSIDAELIGQELMNRLSEVMPVLPVPIIAQLFQDAPEWTVETVKAALKKKFDTAPHGYAHIPADDFEDVFAYTLTHLRKRQVILETDGTLTINPQKAHLIPYYAASGQKSIAT